VVISCDIPRKFSEAGEGVTEEGIGADHLFGFSFNGQRLTLL